MKYNHLVKKKNKPKFNENAAIRGALRRLFARSPIVQEVVQSSRKEAPRYNKDGSRHKKNWVQRECQVCGAWVSSSKINVDHIVPVVSVDEGFIDWNTFVSRLFCNKNNLQRICSTCHDNKTHKETTSRLYKKYMEELDKLEVTISVSNISTKELTKTLNKYIAKKKTIEFQSVVQRAQELKNKIKEKQDVRCKKGTK